MVHDNLKRRNVSVVIPALNEATSLPQLLEQLKRQCEQPHEIIVVDGGSTDGTPEIAKKTGAVVLETNLAHIAKQRNMGAQKASGDVLLFLDADVLIDEKFLETSLSTMLRRKASIACPHYLPQSPDLPIKIFFTMLNACFKLLAYVRPSGGGNAIFIQKDLFTKIGGFPELSRYEDAALISKASRAGTYTFLPTKVIVSTRRFKTHGTYRTIGKYMVLGILFTCGLYRVAQKVAYPYGNYTST